jgi:hypothetical protein
MTANDGGKRGDATVSDVMSRNGWKLLDQQIETFGLHIDWLMTDPDGTDCLVEIKSWGSGPSGKDTIKKALADAYYLNSRGDDRPYVLVLTHEPQPTYREMVRQAILDGAIARAIVVTLTDIEL